MGDRRPRRRKEDVTTTYTYDIGGRLISLTPTNVTPQNFVYDQGNRLAAPASASTNATPSSDPPPPIAATSSPTFKDPPSRSKRTSQPKSPMHIRPSEAPAHPAPRPSTRSDRPDEKHPITQDSLTSAEDTTHHSSADSSPKTHSDLWQEQMSTLMSGMIH